MSALSFPPPPSETAEIKALRLELRAFLAEALADMPASERARSWMGFSADFSAELGGRGWLGMTWPRAYGGQERSALERYVVVEELLAAGAPVAAHWIAERQSGPALLKFGSEAQKAAILPRIAAGTCFFCIGMSESGAGSDLAAIRTQAVPVAGGFIVNGTKLWTTYAHKAHYMILFCRTDTNSDRHGGTSQFLVDLTTPGIRISPIVNQTGEHDFNEVSFQDVFLPEAAILGRLGNGWQQVTSELAFERSGPERFLSSFTLLEILASLLGERMPAGAVALGRLTAHLMVLRRLSRSVALLLHQNADPALQASVVKELGAELEQAIPEAARLLLTAEPDLTDMGYAGVLARTMLDAPGFSLRGGTREILRGIIARGLGLR